MLQILFWLMADPLALRDPDMREFVDFMGELHQDM